MDSNFHKDEHPSKRCPGNMDVLSYHLLCLCNWLLQCLTYSYDECPCKCCVCSCPLCMEVHWICLPHPWTTLQSKELQLTSTHGIRCVHRFEDDTSRIKNGNNLLSFIWTKNPIKESEYNLLHLAVHCHQLRIETVSASIKLCCEVVHTGHTFFWAMRWKEAS